LFENLAGQLFDGLLFPAGGLTQGQETLFVHLDFEMTPLDVHVEIDRLQGFLVVGDAVRIPELPRLFIRLELVRQWIRAGPARTFG
jgi:hypothetical protein